MTLWAAPGSQVNGRVEPFGREGEWTRWSNVRNTLTLAGRFLGGGRRFDVIHNFGRLAYLAPVLRARRAQSADLHADRRTPPTWRRARRLGARRLHYTAVSAAIRDTGRPGGGDWSVIYNCAVPERYPFAGDHRSRDCAAACFSGRLDRCKGAHHAIAVARRLQRRLIIAGNISPLAHERQYFEDEIAPQIDGTLVTYIGPVDDEQKRALLGSAAAMLHADRVGGAVSGRAAGIDAVRHAAHRVPARRRARRDRSRPHRIPVRHRRRDGRAGRAPARDRSPRRAGRGRAPLQRTRRSSPTTNGSTRTASPGAWDGADRRSSSALDSGCFRACRSRASSSTSCVSRSNGWIVRAQNAAAAVAAHAACAKFARVAACAERGVRTAGPDGFLNLDLSARRGGRHGVGLPPIGSRGRRRRREAFGPSSSSSTWSPRGTAGVSRRLPARSGAGWCPANHRAGCRALSSGVLRAGRSGFRALAVPNPFPEDLPTRMDVVNHVFHRGTSTGGHTTSRRWSDASGTPVSAAS